jgi:hypothetical protein
MLIGNNSNLYPVVAIISSGPDKTFTTTCRNFSDADVNTDNDLNDTVDLELVGKAIPADDDIIYTYTYQEATSASGGLWNLKSNDPSKAVISKDLEVSGGASFTSDLSGTGDATFQGTGVFARLAASSADFLQMVSGLKLATPTNMPVCNAANLGVMRLNATGDALEICSLTNTWDSVSGAAKAFDAGATCTVTADSGKVRYNTVTGQPEFCDGTTWRKFILANNAAFLLLNPSTVTNLNVDFATSATNSMGGFRHTTINSRTFTITNTGEVTSQAITTTLSNTTNFEFTANTCSGFSLLAGASCSMTVRPRANSNGAITGTLSIS